MTSDAYTLSVPDTQTSHMVFASPHSGRAYSAEFLHQSVLDEVQIRSSEDAFMDLLIARGVSCGVPVLTAKMPRAFLDLNRGAGPH